jgi:hypothetical protein
MFDVFYSGTKPGVLAHEQQADSIEHAQQLSRTEYFWWITYLSDYSTFDFLYVPPPWQEKFTHVWPSQHHEYSGTYLVPRTATQTQYHFHAETLPNKELDENYLKLTPAEFDHTWAPHPHDPPYVYVFGNQWWPAETWPTVEYHVPGATERKYMDTPRAVLPQNPNRPWYNMVADCDWDYSWRPDPGDPPYVYVFGNQWWPAEKMPTVEYRTPDATERKFVSWPRAKLLPDRTAWTIPDNLNVADFDFSWVPDPGSPPLIYQFGTQWQRTGGPQYVVPGATEVKYQTCPRAIKTSKDANWLVPDSADAGTFDWTWHPDATEPPYVYQFATQHQRTGGPQYVVPGATEVKYVDQIRIEILANSVPIYEIDHLDGNAGQIPNTVRRVRYFDNYRDTLIRLAKSIGSKHEYVWVCSSICDYSAFDFSWHPEAWQAAMLHVFASNEQKFGDTFFMHVPTFAARAESKALLDWYDVNYVPDVVVPRRAMPVIHHTDDTHVEAVQRTDWAGPLALFTVNHEPMTLPTVSVWRQETKTIVPLSAGASAVIVPKTAKADIRTQLYDYPYIDKSERKRHSDQPLDIVFISNGESNAFDHWIRLVDHTSYLPNRLVQIADVKGRVAAYHAAAKASTTPWFFAVFAKLEIDTRFDWSWQPDRMQRPKHYIFHAANPVNGLVYGHQAMIAYNRDLVLNNTGHGLDFTLDSAHEVVPVLSGVARYHDTPWMTWRTAFREVLKLKASLPDVESEYRLNKWLTHGQLTNGEWSVWGAEDAVEYYDSVAGDFEQLRKSYDWAWLASYALIRRNLTPD